MVTFLSLPSYPTKKAYGVTTKYTMSALQESGIPTEILSTNNLMPKKFWGRVASFLICSSKQLFRPSFSFIGKYAFVINRVLFCLYLSIEFKKSKSYRFWTRDIRLAFFLQRYFANCRVVLEIHQFPNLSELRYLQRLGGRVLICPISEAIQSRTQKMRLISNSMLLPMGVPEHFYSDEILPLEPKFHVGYFGSFINSGRDQGVSKMIEDLILYLKENSSAKILLVGIGLEGLSFLEKLEIPISLRRRISSYSHLHHSQIPGLMKTCRVLLLPYPEGEFFAARFPIKAMEYAAVRRSLLCTRTISHTNIFTEMKFGFMP